MGTDPARPRPEPKAAVPPDRAGPGSGSPKVRANPPPREHRLRGPHHPHRKRLHPRRTPDGVAHDPVGDRALERGEFPGDRQVEGEGRGETAAANPPSPRVRSISEGVRRHSRQRNVRAPTRTGPSSSMPLVSPPRVNRTGVQSPPGRRSSTPAGAAGLERATTFVPDRYSTPMPSAPAATRVAGRPLRRSPRDGPGRNRSSHGTRLETGTRGRRGRGQGMSDVFIPKRMGSLHVSGQGVPDPAPRPPTSRGAPGDQQGRIRARTNVRGVGPTLWAIPLGQGLPGWR